MRNAILIGAMGATILATTAFAADKQSKITTEARPPVFEALVNCRTISDPTERLACYDAKVAAIDEAEKKDEIVLADRESMKEARRGLFGFSLPKIKIFGDKAEDDIDELETALTSARRDRDGNWVITLEDGARWQQLSGSLALAPKPGMKVRIRKASLGSFLVNIGAQPAIKMKRIN